MIEKTPSAIQTDRFSYKHVVGWVLLYAFLYFTPQGNHFEFILAMSTLLFIVALGIAWLVAAGLNLARRRWLHFSSILLAPLLFAGLALFVRTTGYNFFWMRFQLEQPDLKAEVHAMSSIGPKYHVWHWGDSGNSFGSALILTDLVYDETNRTNSLKTDDPRESINVQRLGDHFFLVEKGYQ